MRKERKREVSRVALDYGIENPKKISKGIFMLGGIKKQLNVARAALTIQSAGLSKELAMLVAVDFPEGAWKNLMKCTKGLNQECRNLCHSVSILTLFEGQQRARVENGELDKTAAAKLDITLEAIDRLWIAIEQQGMKGDKLALDGAFRKMKSVFNF